MRILVTASPLMYRESIALHIHQSRPRSEVMLAPPGSLDDLAQGFDPHLRIRDEDGADAGFGAGALCRFGLFYDYGGMHARIGLDDEEETREVRNAGMADLLGAMDQTERLIQKELSDRRPWPAPAAPPTPISGHRLQGCSP